jgi:propanediol dehydratase small subunit
MYPLGEYEKESIRSKTGKKLEDITLEAIKKGQITADDIKISKEMLDKQGKVAKENDNHQLAENFERASELVDVPDEIMLRMYNKLRPNRATKTELVALEQELLEKYKAVNCAKLVNEAVKIYEKRGILI